MRSFIRTALLSLVLGAGVLSAGDLPTAQMQVLLSAAQAAAVDKEVTVPVTVNGKEVQFKVTRDAFGKVTARPVPDASVTGVVISQITISTFVNADGKFMPNSVVVVMSDKTILSYDAYTNKDGTLAGLYKPGSGPGDPVVGAVGGTQIVLTKFTFLGWNIIDALPAGAGTANLSVSR